VLHWVHLVCKEVALCKQGVKFQVWHRVPKRHDMQRMHDTTTLYRAPVAKTKMLELCCCDRSIISYQKHTKKGEWSRLDSKALGLTWPRCRSYYVCHTIQKRSGSCGKRNNSCIVLLPLNRPHCVLRRNGLETQPNKRLMCC
jgi:hypothetical protein